MRKRIRIKKLTDKPIFDSFSSHSYFQVLLVRLFLLGIIISALMHFEQNMVATSIAIIICGWLYFRIGLPSIVVYSNRFEYKSDLLFFFYLKRTTFHFMDIKSILFNGMLTPAFDMLDDTRPGTSFLSRSMNWIDLEFKDGRRVTLKPQIHISDFKMTQNTLLKAFREYHVNNRNSIEMDQ